jgi:hypothetical protein
MTQTPNNNFSPLPFYTSIAEQNHRKSYAYGAVYPLYAPSAFLLPFQIMREHRSNSVVAVLVYTKIGEFVVDATQALQIGGLRVVEYSDYGIDVILFPANIANNLQLQDGQYYLQLTDGLQIWYSEVLTIVQDTTPYLMVEWYDVEDLFSDCGIISYQYNYKNRLYFATELGKPDYPFEEEGESRDGYFFAESQISGKTYKFAILAPEYLIDVMRLIRLSDIVRITDKHGRQYDCDTFLITPEWQEQGDLASVTVEFETATIVKKIGRGYLSNNGKSFNADFNDDYN